MAADVEPSWQERSVRGTLRLRITALAVAIAVVVLTITGVLLVSAQHGLLEAQVDHALIDRADELETEITAADRWPPGLDTTADPDILWLIYDDEANILEGTGPLVSFGGVSTGQVMGRTEGTDEEGYPLRVLERGLARGGLIVAADLEDVLISTRTLTELLLVAIPLVALVLAALLWWVVGRALRPVEAIRAEVATIGGADLTRRVPQPPGDDEIARLARTMNDMLGRLQDATERQRRFVADASHELRTPITRMRAQLEVELAHPTDDPRRALIDALGETTALQGLAADLLDLARADGGAVAAVRQPVDLDDLVLAEAARLRSGGRLRVDASAVSAAAVVGDRSAIARAIGNLVDNAERHALSRVTLDLAEHATMARLVVADDGPGVPAAQRERIFERFGRADDARTRGGGGTGLGLAIAREIARAHGGDVALHAPYDGGARFVLELPLAPD